MRYKIAVLALGVHSSRYVFGSELLEQHHTQLLRGLQLPRQLNGFVNTNAPLLAGTTTLVTTASVHHRPA